MTPSRLSESSDEQSDSEVYHGHDDAVERVDRVDFDGGLPVPVRMRIPGSRSEANDNQHEGLGSEGTGRNNRALTSWMSNPYHRGRRISIRGGGRASDPVEASDSERPERRIDDSPSEDETSLPLGNSVWADAHDQYVDDFDDRLLHRVGQIDGRVRYVDDRSGRVVQVDGRAECSYPLIGQDRNGQGSNSIETNGCSMLVRDGSYNSGSSSSSDRHPPIIYPNLRPDDDGVDGGGFGLDSFIADRSMVAVGSRASGVAQSLEDIAVIFPIGQGVRAASPTLEMSTEEEDA